MHLANEVMAAAMELDATASADSFDIVGSQSQPALSAAVTTGATTSDGDSDAAVAGVSSSGGVGRSGGGGGSNSASGLAPASASVVGGSAGSSRRAPQPRMSLAIRRAHLAKLRDCLPEPLASSSGQSRCVPFLLQLYPLLTTAAAAGSADDEIVNNCLEALFDLLPKFSPAKAASFCTRTPRNELCLMVLRLLSELLAAKLPGQVGEFIAKRLLSTAESDSNFLDFALACIKELDRDYVRQHHSDLLSGYAQLLTELVFRLPTQLCQHRGQLQLHFSDAWYSELCELTSGSCVRRLARRLLLAAAGNSKDLVRRKRDLHAYANQTGQIRQICAQVGVIGEELQLSYQSLLSVMDSLKACVALATARPGNWQWHCFQEQQQQLSAADDSAINNK
uniref:Protein VAC14 homolog n=1 Tax=Macrostomum lignano TaxID=282301 RepID=A0A1I8IT00_9PLAT